MTFLVLSVLTLSETSLNLPDAHGSFTPSLKPNFFTFLTYLVEWSPCTLVSPPHVLLEQTWYWLLPSDPSRHEAVCCGVFSPKWKRDVIATKESVVLRFRRHQSHLCLTQPNNKLFKYLWYYNNWPKYLIIFITDRVTLISNTSTTQALEKLSSLFLKVFQE